MFFSKRSICNNSFIKSQFLHYSFQIAIAANTSCFYCYVRCTAKECWEMEIIENCNDTAVVFEKNQRTRKNKESTTKLKWGNLVFLKVRLGYIRLRIDLVRYQYHFKKNVIETFEGSCNNAKNSLNCKKA